MSRGLGDLLEDELAPGTYWASYHVLGPLGRGGMSQIYLARAPSRGNPLVVIKRIRPSLNDQEHVRAFLREARLMTYLQHGNIVNVVELVEHAGENALIIEFLDGRNLAQIADVYARRQRFTPYVAVARIMADTLAALDHVHTRTDSQGRSLNLLHRDVSPDNIVVTFPGVVKLVDFGIAKSDVHENLTRTGLIKGKPGHVSPEAIDGKTLDGRADIFSLGVSFYQMLTHERPFGGNNPVSMLEAIALDAPFPMRAFNMAVPKELEQITMRALEKNPKQRWQTARDMQMALWEYIYKQGDPPDLGVLMEGLFPAATDPDRARLANIVRRTARPPPMPSDAPRESSTSLTPIADVNAALGGTDLPVVMASALAEETLDDIDSNTMMLNTAMLAAVLEEDT